MHCLCLKCVNKPNFVTKKFSLLTLYSVHMSADYVCMRGEKKETVKHKITKRKLILITSQLLGS